MKIENFIENKNYWLSFFIFYFILSGFEAYNKYYMSAIVSIIFAALCLICFYFVRKNKNKN